MRLRILESVYNLGLRALMLASLCFLVTSCAGRPPVEDYTLARAAYQAAKDVDAPRYSAATWVEAEESYRRAEKAFDQRDYSAAKSYFEEARFLCEKAENSARVQKAQSGGL